MFVYMFSFNHNALLRPAPAKKHPTKKNPVAEIEWLAEMAAWIYSNYFVHHRK